MFCSGSYFSASKSTEAYLNEQDARRPTGTVPFSTSFSSRLDIYTCTAFAVQAPNIPRDKPLLLPPGMDEAGDMAPSHEDACVEPGEDHSAVASASGTSSGSLCSLASRLSDDASYSPPDHSSGSSSTSSSTLQLDSEEGPLYELSSLLAQLPARRGLSKYYQGKSQSFTSISDATCLQDLGKEATYNKRMKTCKRQELYSRIGHESAVESLTKDMQQDDSEEAFKRFICLSIVQSKHQQPIVQPCQFSCTPGQERCTNAYELLAN